MDYGYIPGIYSGVMVVISSVVRAANVSTAKAHLQLLVSIIGHWTDTDLRSSQGAFPSKIN